MVLVKGHSNIKPIKIFCTKGQKALGITIMMVHQKGKVFVLNPLHRGRRGGRQGPFSARKSPFFLCYTHITPIFWGQTDPTQWYHSPPYPEVTLDNFSFLAGGRLAARRAVFWPLGQILVIFGDSYLRKKCTPNGPRSKKLGRIVRFTK